MGPSTGLVSNTGSSTGLRYSLHGHAQRHGLAGPSMDVGRESGGRSPNDGRHPHMLGSRKEANVFQAHGAGITQGDEVNPSPLRIGACTARQSALASMLSG